MWLQGQQYSLNHVRDREAVLLGDKALIIITIIILISYTKELFYTNYLEQVIVIIN